MILLLNCWSLEDQALNKDRKKTRNFPKVINWFLLRNFASSSLLISPLWTSAVNCWSLNTVKPSFRDSWNQSLQVTLLPVQLWKYSWAITPSILSNSSSVVVSEFASISFELKILRLLFSIAPILKCLTATILNNDKSYSRLYLFSSHLIDFFKELIACWTYFSSPYST